MDRYVRIDILEQGNIFSIVDKKEFAILFSIYYNKCVIYGGGHHGKKNTYDWS